MNSGEFRNSTDKIIECASRFNENYEETDATDYRSTLHDLNPKYDIQEGLRNPTWMGGVAVALAWTGYDNVVAHPGIAQQIEAALKGRSCRQGIKDGELCVTFRLASFHERDDVAKFAYNLGQLMGTRAEWEIFKSIRSKAPVETGTDADIINLFPLNISR